MENERGIKRKLEADDDEQIKKSKTEEKEEKLEDNDDDRKQMKTAEEKKEEKKKEKKKAEKKGKKAGKEKIDHCAILARRYNIHDPVALASGLQVLHEKGYAVFSDMVTAEQLKVLIDYFWEYMEAACPKVKRSVPSTWSNTNWPGLFSVGIFKYYGIGQSKFMWYLRTLPTIRQFYEAAYPGVTDFVTSFDGCGVFRGGEHKVDFNQSWLHVDQNLQYDSSLQIQCAINMLDVPHARDCGSFLVQGMSHLAYRALIKKKDPAVMEWTKKKKHFCPQGNLLFPFPPPLVHHPLHHPLHPLLPPLHHHAHYPHLLHPPLQGLWGLAAKHA